MQSTFVFALDDCNAELPACSGLSCCRNLSREKKVGHLTDGPTVLESTACVQRRTYVLPNVLIEVFQVLANGHHELVCVSAINNAVIVAH